MLSEILLLWYSSFPQCVLRPCIVGSLGMSHTLWGGEACRGPTMELQPCGVRMLRCRYYDPMARYCMCYVLIPLQIVHFWWQYKITHLNLRHDDEEEDTGEEGKWRWLSMVVIIVILLLVIISSSTKKRISNLASCRLHRLKLAGNWLNFSRPGGSESVLLEPRWCGGLHIWSLARALEA